MQYLVRYTNTLPVFGFNSGRYDINLIKSYLIPYLISEKDIEPSVIKKANDFVSFKIGNVQLLVVIKFFGGATSLDFFLKAYKASEMKGYFPYEWFDTPNKLDEQQLPSYDDFYSKLKNSNPLDKEYDDFQKLLNSGLTEEQALKKLGLETKPLTELENYNYLKSIWEQEKMTSFCDFLRWYNNKDVVPTLDAMQKMIEFYHDKGIDMLKLGCTLPNLAKFCLHKSTDYEFDPFFSSDIDLLEKIREDMTGGPSIVFTRKATANESFLRKSNNLCKSIVGIDASQLYPYSMCQDMPTGLYTRWDYDEETQKFKARHNRVRTIEIVVMAYFQATRLECKIESYYATGKHKKIDCFSVDGYCNHCRTVFEAMVCYFHFVLVKKLDRA